MKSIYFLLFVPGLAFAQAAPTPGFTAEAKPLEQASLLQRISGKAFTYKNLAGTTVRVEYKENGYVFVNVGAAKDNGKWRIEDSSVCVEFSRFPSGCSEFRSVGETLQVMLKSNGEVVNLNPI